MDHFLASDGRSANQPGATSTRHQAAEVCNAFASFHDARIQTSNSSGLVKITGMAFGWMGATTPFGSDVRKAKSSCSPSRGVFIEPRTPCEPVQMPAKNARGALSSKAKHRNVFFGFVSSDSENFVHGTRQWFSNFSQRRQCGDPTLRMLVTPVSICPSGCSAVSACPMSLSPVHGPRCRCKGCAVHAVFCANSRRRSSSFRSSPHVYPNADPSLFTTRWHGMAIARGLLAQALATALADFALPSLRANSS